MTLLILVPQNGIFAAQDSRAVVQSFALKILESMGATPQACSETVQGMTGIDKYAFCASGEKNYKLSKKQFEQTAQSATFAKYNFINVDSWDTRDPAHYSASFWLGAVSLEVVLNKQSTEIVLLISKPYPRCGDDIPFMPTGFDDGNSKMAPPLTLDSTTYPALAFKKKIDGSVALAVEIATDGTPSVLCIHHASPADFGFELSAIATVHGDDASFAIGDVQASGSFMLNMLVHFSRADARPKGYLIKHH